MSDNIPQLPVVSFGNNVREAIGAIKAPDLLQLFTWEARQRGESYKVPCWRAKGSTDATGAFIQDAATTRKTKVMPDAKRFAELAVASQTFAEFQKTLTPHQDIDEWFTIATPSTIETGHTFSRADNIQALNDPTSRTIMGIAQNFFISKQKLGMAALTAASVNRQTKNTTSTEALPDTQKYTSKNVGYLKAQDDFALLRAKLDLANVPDKSVANMIMHPLDAAAFINASFDRLYNFDFVEAKHLRDGNIPEIFGFRILKSNLCPKGKFYAWLPGAISVVPFEEQQTRMQEDIGHRACVRFYMWETMDAVRVDDLGVIHGTINGGSSSGSSSSGSSSSGSSSSQ